jgi:ferritin-like protein
MVKVHKDIQDIINAVSLEMNIIQKSIDNLSGLDNDMIEVICEEMKFKKFLHGILVIQRIFELQIESLNVAEMQEDDNYQIEIEALKLESDTCLATL